MNVAHCARAFDSGSDNVHCRCAPCFFAAPASRQAITVAFDGEVYPVRAAPPSPGAPLYAAHPCRQPRSRADDAAARQREGRRENLRRSTAAGSRRGCGGCRTPSPFAHGTLLPLRGVDHRIEHRKGARGTVWTEIGATACALLCVAGEAPHLPRRVRDFLKREAKRDLEAASRRAAEALGVSIKRVSVRDQSSRWGSCSTTGVLVIFLAAHSGAAIRARLSRRARGRPSDRDESFAAVLAAGREDLSRHGARQGLARRAWRRPASLRPERKNS